jgi:hypothetical protein
MVWFCSLRALYGSIFYGSFLLKGSLYMLMHTDIKLRDTCFGLSIVVELILVSMIIWLKTYVHDRFIKHVLDSVQI